MPLTFYANDTFVAPGMSEFTSASIKDMSQTSKRKNTGSRTSSSTRFSVSM
jgi:hypothetical protein